MTEDQLEKEALGWLAEVGYTPLFGPDIAVDGDHPERSDYRQVLLFERLRAAIYRLNSDIPLPAKEDAIKQVVNLGIPALHSAKRRFHQLLITGVPVKYQKDGETRGDFVRLIDWGHPSNNEYLAINQFSIKGHNGKNAHTRRPDIILFVNGLPLVLVELKNPADEKADIWKAFDQIQTYEEQIADVFLYNEVLVISDGSEARLADNESAVRELGDEILKKIAHELTENLRQNLTVDWSSRASVRAKLRLMVKRILRKYKYPPDQQEVAVELVLQQAQALSEAWV
jgi:type I restriction enzyme R subunit